MFVCGGGEGDFGLALDKLGLGTNGFFFASNAPFCHSIKIKR
jgi:hypothetical protein